MRVMIFAALVGTTALWGCGGGSSSATPVGPTTPPAVGAFALQSLDGRVLPTSISEGGRQVEVLSGELALGANGSIRISTVYRTSPGGPATTTEVNGSYTAQGNSLSFSYTNGGRNTGTLNGDVLQMVNDGVVWLYRRA